MDLGGLAHRMDQGRAKRAILTWTKRLHPSVAIVISLAA